MYPRILKMRWWVEAQRLFKDANDMLDKLSAEKLNPRGGGPALANRG